MNEAELHRFLDSFDRSTATGCRDYAMAQSMVRLGLRVSEVAELKLQDVDWHNGVLRIHSAKRRRLRELPLPQDVGSAIANYVKSGRPNSSSNSLFLRHSVPVGTSVSRELVRGVIRRAYQRSGCSSNWTGTHVLRHTAATCLHQHGASLKEIADLLGHRSIDTSMIYTKVNLRSLDSVALPWPKEVQS
jgi:site-specific recombinase XerD